MSTFHYDEDAAERAVEFFDRFLTHVKGELAGQPLELQDWAKDEIVRPLFGWKREDGTRRYRTVYVEVPRKNAKSTISAGIALYLLIADGEPGAEVYSAAADREQARIVFEMARDMVNTADPLRKRTKVYRSSITVPGTGSYYKALSADAYTKHGLNAHGVIFDELHAQRSRDLWDVLRTSMGARREPVLFAITTAGVFDPQSICYELHDYAIKVRDGIIDDDAFLPVLYYAEKDDDWTDPDVWEKANPGLGTTVKWEYLERECAMAQESPAAQNTFRRLHLNQWTEQETRWLDMDVWDENGDEPESLEDRRCFIGLDMSTTTDLTAWVAVAVGDRVIDVDCHFYVPEDSIQKRVRRDRVPYDAWVRDGWITATPGNVVDYEYIRRDINRFGETSEIREIAYDPWNAEQLAVQLDNQDGFEVVKHRQGFASMAGPTKELEKLLVGRKIRHGNNPVLRWMAANVAVTQDAAGNIKPAKDKSSERIDGIVALIMAIGLAVLDNDGGSVYEDRGVLVL